jgi:anti-sigma regulatory factor (Ser/Thr protein kinase)
MREVVLMHERFDLHNLAEVRSQVRAVGRAAGLAPELTEGLTVATGEAMTNAILHGGPVHAVTVSVVEDVGVIAEVYDNGRATAFGPPPQAPPPEREGGRGLLPARALCDRVSVTTGRHGTVLQLEIDYR